MDHHQEVNDKDKFTDVHPKDDLSLIKEGIEMKEPKERSQVDRDQSFFYNADMHKGTNYVHSAPRYTGKHCEYGKLKKFEKI